MKTDNEMISEFTGLKGRINHLGQFVYQYPIDESQRIKEAIPLYHVSWDWLMPVVERIGWELGYRVTIDSKFTRIWLPEDKTIEYTNLEGSLDATYKAVVDFIK